jgi:hypothetical protein
MANTFNPFGFQAAQLLIGASPTYSRRAYNILYSNTHAIYSGDIVTMLSTGYIDTLAPGSVAPLGIFDGCQYVSASQNKLVYSPYYPGSDQITSGTVTAFVLDDPNMMFMAQTGYSGAGSGPATQANVGYNVQYANGTGSTLSGLSGAYIDLTTAPGTTSTLPFRIVSLVADPPTVNGSDTSTQYNNVIVAWNNQYYRQLTAV